MKQKIDVIGNNELKESHVSELEELFSSDKDSLHIWLKLMYSVRNSSYEIMVFKYIYFFSPDFDIMVKINNTLKWFDYGG